MWSASRALLLVQLGSMLVPLFVLPYLAHVLPVQEFAAVAFAQSAYQICVVIVDFGFPTWGTHAIASDLANETGIRALYKSVTACRLVLAAASMLALLAFGLLSGTEYRQELLFIWPAVLAQAFQPLWFLQGVERVERYAHILVVLRVTFVAGVLLAVHNPGDGFWSPLLTSITAIIGAAAGTWLARGAGARVGVPSLESALLAFKGGAAFFASRAAVATYTLGGTFYLGLVGTPVQTASYAAAEQLYRGALSLVSPLPQALYPQVSRTREMRVVALWGIGATAATAVGALIFHYVGAQLLLHVFGEKLARAFDVLTVFSFAALFAVPSMFAGFPLHACIGNLRWANISLYFGGVCQTALLVGLYFTGNTSATLVALGVVAAEATVLLIRMKSAVSYFGWLRR